MKDESETEEEPIQESFQGDLKRVSRWLRSKRNVIIIVCLWTAVISSVTILEYYNLYETDPLLRQPGYVVAFSPTESLDFPRLYTLDYVVILVASLLAGYMIADIEDTLYGFLASGILSTLISVAYSTLFLWYVLGLDRTYDFSFITTIIWAASLNVFRMLFPIALLTVFLGSLFGSFFRGYFQPSATD